MSIVQDVMVSHALRCCFGRDKIMAKEDPVELVLHGVCTGAFRAYWQCAFYFVVYFCWSIILVCSTEL